MKKRLVVVGNGMAGARAVEEVLSRRRGGAVRRRHVRRRALRQLQSHSAVEHPEWRSDDERDLHQSARLVRGKTASGSMPAPASNEIDRAAKVVTADERHPRALRQAPDRDRQPRFHSAHGRREWPGRQHEARRLRLPHHRRLRCGIMATGQAKRPRRGDRRRPAGPGSGARAHQSWLRGARRPPRRASHGNAARRVRRRDPQGQHGGDGRQRSSQEAHHRDSGRGQGHGARLQGRHHARLRHGRDRGGYQAECGDRIALRAHGRARHRRRQPHALGGRLQRLRRRRVRAAPRPRLRPGGAAMGAGQGFRRPHHGPQRRCRLSRLEARDQAQGHGRRARLDGDHRAR